MTAGLVAAPDETLVSVGAMAAIHASPAREGPAAAVVLFPHVGGLTVTMQAMAEHVASLGYVCVVPDLYHRLGRIVLDPQSDDPDAADIRRIAAASVTEETAMADLGAVLDWIGRQPRVLRRAVGAVGFGRGGSFAVLAAARYPGRIRAAASVLGYGFSGGVHGEALRALGDGGAYFAFAEHDEVIPASEPRLVAALLKESSLHMPVVVHPGTRHPYIFPDRAVFDPAAAGKDWAAIDGLFRRRLVDGEGRCREGPL